MSDLARERDRNLAEKAALERELDHRADVIAELADQVAEFKLALIRCRGRAAS